MVDFVIGKVIAIKNGKVEIHLDELSTQLKYYHNGNVYDAPQIGSLLLVKHSNIFIIVSVESENLIIKENNKYEIDFIRSLNTKILGYMDDGKFHNSPKYSPIAYADVYLTDSKISNLVIRDYSLNEPILSLGCSLDNSRYNLPIQGLLNSHIGIFGNTGSGKSNTLTKIYSELFEKFDTANSRFVFIDFNGEYTNENVLANNKDVKELSTRTMDNEKLKLPEDYIWDSEILSILFDATEKTQQPLLKRVVENRKKYFRVSHIQSLNEYIKITFDRFFSLEKLTFKVKEAFDNLLEVISSITNIKYELVIPGIYWHSTDNFGEWGNENSRFLNINNQNTYEVKYPNLSKLNFTQELLLRVLMYILNGVSKNQITYEHVKPLINKIRATMNDLNKVIELGKDEIKEKSNIKVISLRDCNQSMKKIIPLLICKYEYEKIKKDNSKDINRTTTLVIDEAHNILSYTSNRESETWKDYRLETFEEIIKEGRKFGMYLTVSSQRPGDISDTIVSQLHNYFIHRLVNENDLTKLKNQLSELSSNDFSFIPRMNQGMCIIAGTKIQPSKVVQVDYIKVKEKRPKSDDTDLFKDAGWHKK